MEAANPSTPGDDRVGAEGKGGGVSRHCRPELAREEGIAVDGRAPLRGWGREGRRLRKLGEGLSHGGSAEHNAEGDE